MDPTQLRAEVEALLARAVGLRFPYADRDAFVQTMVDSSNVIDDLTAILDDLDEKIGAALADAGVVTKRCAWCGWWFVANGAGRPRRTCSAKCRTAYARSQ